MASEAEFERLYQLFVANGGGNLTFSGSNLTPKQYSEAVSSSNLTPLQMAQLEAKQHQYNRQSALNTIANEVDANNFSNPYAARGVYGTSLLNTLGANAGSIQAGLINGAFSGFTDSNRALVVAGVLSATGVDLEKLIKVAGIAGLGTAMYTSLTSHTNNQTANIPKTMEDASSLSAMNEQFGEQGDPCSFFNQLMGILAGIMDGTLDFIEKGIGDITSFLNKTGISALLASIVSAISGAIGGVATAIGAVVGLLVGAGLEIIKALIPIASKVISAISEITTVIASEINALADMAAELLKKALALLIGSAASDPCKKKVLENTGSTEMKEAITKLNHPLGTTAPPFIKTSTDTRVNPDDVERIMANVKEQSLIDDGVPQSPFTDTGQHYTPYDSSLHDTTATDFFTRKIVSRQYGNRSGSSAYNDWMPRQLAYTRDSGNLINKMQNTLSTKDFTNKISLRNRLKQLIIEQSIQSDVIARLRTNVRDEFTYVTKDPRWYDKIDDANERRIASKYQSIIKPAMTRTYNAAVTSLNNTQTEWISIDNQVY
jgi:hypothetical protein